MGMAVTPVYTVEDVLVAARKMIEDPERWAKRRYIVFDPPMSSVPSFCAMGAIQYSFAGPSSLQTEALNALYDALPPFYHRGRGDVVLQIGRFNDAVRRRHKDIMDLYDRAIAAVRAAQ